jgi:hypothetical protein
MPNHVLQTTLTLVRAGLSVIPIGTNKRPVIDSWKCYQTRIPTPEEWTAWCAHRPCGLAVVLGSVSGNAEVIDIDDAPILRPWYDLVAAMEPGLVSRLVIVKTPTNGRHLYYSGERQQVISLLVETGTPLHYKAVAITLGNKEETIRKRCGRWQETIN